MTHRPLWISLAFVPLAVAACAADEGGGRLPPPIDPTTVSGVGGASSGAGGQGQGGDGGEDLGPCGTDCSEFNPPQCFKSVCNTGMYPGPIGSCVVVEDDDGLPCDDGLFCTVDDTCQDGTCTGGEENDCGMDAVPCQNLVCDEDDQTCDTEPVANGEACDSGDLCVTGAVCTNGLCSGGNTEDCFLQPVPNDCYVSTCNPSNGQCEPVIGNEGLNCTDLSDLCTVDKTCSSGSCVGGVPKDCSAAAMECEVGVCDMATGNCGGAPGMSGQSCMSAADQCNTGSCDASGMCQPVPIADGTPCNDQQACTNSDMCQAGTCTGVTTATCSLVADGCCPPACDAISDIDCACGIDDFIIEEVSTASPDFVLLKNTSTCPLDIDPITVCKDEGSSELCSDLPPMMLGPGEEIYLLESGGVAPPAPALSLNLTFSMGWEGTAGAIFICDGPCTNASAPNALDAVIWLTSTTVTLPTGINFTPGPVPGVDSTNDAVKRTAVTGSYPNFFASDWVAQPASYD